MLLSSPLPLRVSRRRIGNLLAKDQIARKLAVTIDNNKSVLAVIVIASGSASTYSEAQLSDSIFGNAGDLWNLKQGYSDCSRGQLIINEAADRSGSNVSISNGVVTIDLGTSVASNADDATMSNAVTSTLNSAFSVDSPSELADHVMYCLPPKVKFDGIAYAFHNLNMHHSGEGTNEYADQSGMMGFSYSEDETPKMCFNGAKNWQFGWFTPRHKAVSSNYVGELRSTLVYDPFNPNPEGPPMLIKVANGGSDFFIAFNRATSYNAGTKEGQNQVMITQAGNGSNFARSYIKAKLRVGASYTFDTSGVPVTVSVQDINTTNFGFANISISPAPTPNPTAFDQCSLFSIGGKCRKEPGCSWNGVRCFSDGAPTSPVAAPSAEPPVGGPNPNDYIADRISCDLGTCCNGCQRNGRWANTCK